MKLKKCIYEKDWILDNFIDIEHYLDPEQYHTIYGCEAKEQFKKSRYYKLESGKLTDTTRYIFYRSKKDKHKLIPIRVSMSPKTAANIERGSARYGSGHIINELLREGW